MTILLRAIISILILVLCGLVVWRWQINGWGSIVWLTTAILMSIIRAPHASRNKANAITEKFSVNMERLLLFLVSAGGTFIPILHLAIGAFSFANFSAPYWFPLIGLAALGPGLWLFWRSHADLGQNWSVTTELRKDHSLVTAGIYEHIRHPMYAAIWLMFAANLFLIQNWIAGPAAIVTFAIMYFVRVPEEEAMMRKEFGTEYDVYTQRTGRIWPRFS